MQLLPPSYRHRHGPAVRVELATDRVFPARNSPIYRFAHWPLWIWVFFIAPGPVVFRLFESGPTIGMLGWLAVVAGATGIAGLRGRLPGVEPAPYILLLGEDRPNPIHRRICYTAAWSAVITYGVLNSVGLIDAIVSGEWRLGRIYETAYLPLAAAVWLAGAFGWLPRAKRSTQGEGYERRYFYGSVWAVTIAQPLLWILWKSLPAVRLFDVLKLVVFWGVMALIGYLARRGLLPRTRPILPGSLAVAD